MKNQDAYVTAAIIILSRDVIRTDSKRTSLEHPLSPDGAGGFVIDVNGK